MPVLQYVEIRADLNSLPESEKAALARIVRAARQVDQVSTNQVWPGTLTLMRERERGAAQDPTGRSELIALDFFKGPWNATGKAFINGVPAVKPIGNFYPADASKPELEAWMQHPYSC